MFPNFIIFERYLLVYKIKNYLDDDKIEEFFISLNIYNNSLKVSSLFANMNIECLIFFNFGTDCLRANIPHRFFIFDIYTHFTDFFLTDYTTNHLFKIIDTYFFFTSVL